MGKVLFDWQLLCVFFFVCFFGLLGTLRSRSVGGGVFFSGDVGVMG